MDKLKTQFSFNETKSNNDLRVMYGIQYERTGSGSR